MGKIKRMPERRLRPLYVSVSIIFIALFLSLSLSTCFLVVLVHVSSLSVHGYSLFSPLDCFCPFFPRLFLRRHSRMSCVLLLFSVFLFVCHCFHLSSQQCLAFLTFVWFGVIDSARFLAVYLQINLHFFILSLSHLLSIIVILILLSRLRTTPTWSGATLTSATAASPPDQRLTDTPICIVSAMHTPSDMGTHADMPIHSHMGYIPLWCLKLPRVVVVMELEIWPLYLDRRRVVRPRFRG